jgi:hypothetical protein
MHVYINLTAIPTKINVSMYYHLNLSPPDHLAKYMKSAPGAKLINQTLLTLRVDI